MVKGVSRRVIVVDSPDRRYFEEAIFILRNDIPLPNGSPTTPVLDEACRIAQRCVQRRRAGAPRMSAPYWVTLGAASVAALWLLTVVV